MSTTPVAVESGGPRAVVPELRASRVPTGRGCKAVDVALRLDLIFTGMLSASNEAPSATGVDMTDDLVRQKARRELHGVIRPAR